MKKTRLFIGTLLLLTSFSLASCDLLSEDSGSFTPKTSDTTGGSTQDVTTKYTVKFNTNGGSSVTSQKVEDGKVASKPSDPTKKGYSFIGWYSDEACNNVYDFATAVTSNITIYAKWSIESYTVSFDVKGGNETIDSQTVEYNGTITKPSDPTKEGYTFGGWYLEQTFDTQATTGAISSDTTLYAKWTQNSQSSTTKVILDPSDLSQAIDKDITNSVTSGDFIIVGTSSKAVTVKNGTSFTYDSHSYETSKSLYLGGGADFSASRYIEFTLSQTSTITIVAKSSSSTSDRTVNMVNASSTGTVVTTFAAGGTQSITTRTDISAGTYRVGSSGSGIYIYAIIIEY